MSEAVIGVERKLTIAEKERLSTAFLRLPRMRDNAKRAVYVEQLAEQFPNVLTARRHEDPQHDVWELLEVCYQLPGAIHRLLEIVTVFNRDSRWLNQLHVMVHRMFPAELLFESERTQLIRLLDEVEVETLAASYRYAARAAPHEPPPDLTDVAAVVRCMEAHVGLPRRLPALFDFADHAAHRTGRGVEGKIHRWLDEVAVRLGFTDRAAIDKMCEATGRRVTELRRYYFAVQLVPDGVLDDRYLLSAWLQQERNPEEPIHRDDKSLPLSGAIERLYDLLRQVPKYVDGGIEELLIELILPRSMITWPADQWQVDPEFPHALGTDFPVVIRSLERLDRPDLHAPWERKWRWLVMNGRRIDPSYFVEVDAPDERNVSALRARLLLHESPGALVMRTPPPESNGLGMDVFSAGLRGGIPVMLWCREPTMSEEFKKELKERLTKGDLFGLPQRVCELRQLAAAESTDRQGSHVGCYITLFWDDFDRIPEAFRYRARAGAPRPRSADNS